MAIKINIPGFEILHRIGEGATSEVFLAKNPAGDLVAVKVLKNVHHQATEGTGKAIESRFQAEWELAKRLQKTLPENMNVILPLENLHTSEYSAHILKYIDGEPLSTYQPRLPFVLPEVSVALCIEILTCLEFAHKNGVIHRDLKPSNILIEKSGKVFLTDFGIAQQTDMTSHTATGMLMGSPDFMSPEQVRGDVLGASSDLFSLSAILYFLVTGMRPFGRNSAIATLTAIQNGQVEVPHLKNPKISAALSRLIMKGLHPKVKDRFFSAVEMKQGLQTYLDGIGLTLNIFYFEKWSQRPSEETFSALQKIAESLVARGEKLALEGHCDAALDSVAHLSLVAPESMHVSRITELILATPPSAGHETMANSRPTLSTDSDAVSRPIKPKPLRLVLSVFAFIIVGVLGFLGGVALMQPSKTKISSVALPSKLETTSPFSKSVDTADVPEVKKIHSAPAKSVAPRERSSQDRFEKIPVQGKAIFDVEKGVKVYFDGEEINPAKPHFAPVGVHKIMLIKAGFAPISQAITLKSSEPTKIVVK